MSVSRAVAALRRVVEATHAVRRGLSARAPRLSAALLALVLSLPVLWFLRDMLSNPTYVGDSGDIRIFHFWWDVSRETILEYGEVPFWNPYYCGGMVHWANVHTSFLYPTMLLGLVFGPGAGMRWHMVLHFVAGFIGCYALARQQGLRGPWALAPGVVFVFGANFVERSIGHVSFMPYLLQPWLLYFYDKSRHDFRYAVPVAVVITGTLLAGGPYPYIMFMQYLALLVLWDFGTDLAARSRHEPARSSTAGLPPSVGARWWRAPAMGGLIVALVILTSAIKLFPVADFVRQYPREIFESDYLAPWQVWEVFLEAQSVGARKGYFYSFGEYRQYLGPIAMAAVPLMLLAWRRFARDYLVILVFGALMLGSFASFAPYTLLREIPVFASLRVPVRYALLVDLHIALLFGHALAGLALLGREFATDFALPPTLRHFGALLAGLALVVCAADLMTNNATQLRGFFSTPPEVIAHAPPFHQIAGSLDNIHTAVSRNEGHIHCDEPNPLKISDALRPDAASEVYLGEGSGRAQLARWSPNRLDIAVDLETPGLLVVNSNFHPGWSAGPYPVRAWRDLLAVELPAGRRALVLTYRPQHFTWYAFLSLLGTLCALAVWRWRARPRAGTSRARDRSARPDADSG